jgi:hypothetical protein
MNASQPWRNRRRVIEMCLDLALEAQTQGESEHTKLERPKPYQDEHIAKEMAARIFAIAELCSCMGWSETSRQLRKTHAELLDESAKDN